MPNRIIHEKALRSHTLAKLSAEAERLFWRLTVVADDLGRFDACPPVVKANCFPTLVDSINTKKVIAWLFELSAECCIFYIVEGRQYGQFCKWSEYQRIYGNKPKFPQPPADCGSSPQNPALILNSISTSTPIPIPTTTSSSDDEGFDRFWEAYPRKVGKKEAAKAWGRAKDRPPLPDILTAIERAKKTEPWLKDNGQFIPHPATWLNQGRWADEVAAKPPSSLERFLARGERDGSTRILSRMAAPDFTTVGATVPGSRAESVED